MNTGSKEKINGYIIAGGKSSRMGSDKGLLFLNNKPIILHVIENIMHSVNEIVIVSNNKEYQKFGLPVIPDLLKDSGPAIGIHSAMSHSRSNRNFIVSCDMPFINQHAVNFIIESSLSTQITLPGRMNKIEPLFGVYSTDCLPKWNDLIQQGNVKLQDMILNFTLNIIQIDKLMEFNKNTFFNINSPSDLILAQGLLPAIK